MAHSSTQLSPARPRSTGAAGQEDASRHSKQASCVAPTAHVQPDGRDRAPRPLLSTPRKPDPEAGPGSQTREGRRRYGQRRDSVRRHPLPSPFRGGQPDPAGDHRLLLQPVHLLRHVPGEALPRPPHGRAGPGDRLGAPAPGRRAQGLPRRRGRPRRQDPLPLRAARPPRRGVPRPAARLRLRLPPVHRDPHRRGAAPAARGGAHPALPRRGVRRRRGAHLARQGRRRRGHDPPGPQGLGGGHEARRRSWTRPTRARWTS